jgi:sensor histidine kinase YesM
MQLKSKLENSSGTGLNNLKERLKLATSQELIIEKNIQSFMVKIPVIKVQK